MNEKELFMLEAIKEAKKAASIDEVPIGAVIVCDGKIVARGYNKREKTQLSTSHAEVIAIEKACKKLKTWRLDECELYVTLEPCPMCAGAIMQARIKKIYYGATDHKAGAIGSRYNLYAIDGFNHYPKFEGYVLGEECKKLLSDFFQKLRRQKGQNE